MPQYIFRSLPEACPVVVYSNDRAGRGAQAGAGTTDGTGRLTLDLPQPDAGTFYSAVSIIDTAVNSSVGEPYTGPPTVPGTVDLSALETAAHASGTYAPATGVGRGVSRVLTKLTTGMAITIAFLGDSGLEGTTVTVPGTDDVASRLCATLGSRFGVSVTKANRASSGYCTYWSLNPGVVSPTKFSQALGDKADLYVFSFGHNDIRSQGLTGPAYAPGTGYSLLASLAAFEHMIRRIRIDVPGADILISTQWPYTGNSFASNTILVPYSRAVQRLSAAYGCGFVDFTAALLAVGVNGTTPAVDDTYIVASHPNTAGHLVWTNAMLALLPSGANPAPESPTMPRPIYGAERYTHAGWAAMPVEATAIRVYGAAGYTLAGSWSVTATLPQTSVTANDKITVQFVGSECCLRIDTGTTGHIKIEVNGATINADLDLAPLGIGQSRLPLTLGVGIHHIVVTVLSGTVIFRGVEYLPALGNLVPYTSGLGTFTGTWTAIGTALDLYAGNGKTTSAQNDTVTVEWVGTALALNGWRYSTAILLGVSTDGGTEVVSDFNLGAGANSYGGYLVTSGLPYGRHTTVIRLASAGRALIVGTFLGYDETRTDRPNTVNGLAVVGDVVATSVALPGRPTIRLVPADALSTLPPYPSADAASGFTVNGTAAAKVLYGLETGRVAF